MKDILIIAHFTQVPGEKGNGRFHYLAEKIDKNESKVEVVTTDFSHRTKKKRHLTKEDLKKNNYKLTLLEEPIYNRNISIKRFYSHYKMAKNLKKYLSGRKKPDLIYCSVPSLDVAHVASKFAVKNDIPFVIDIQDLWPEAFKMIIKSSFINSLLFYPLEKKANSIYSSADKIVAVSETYLNRAKSVNQKSEKNIAVFLGTDLKYFDRLAKENKVEKKMGEIWLTYIGTLGASYDILSVIDALFILKSQGITNIKFIVIGDGPYRKRFEDYAKEKNVDCIFWGRVNYSVMVSLLKVSDIAVNPIMPNSAGSVINKVGDYAAAGLPVLNTQENFEYRELINEYDAGLNCINHSPQDLAEKMKKLYYNSSIRVKMGENNRRLAEEKFDREITYKKILDII